VGVHKEARGTFLLVQKFKYLNFGARYLNFGAKYLNFGAKISKTSLNPNKRGGVGSPRTWGHFIASVWAKKVLPPPCSAASAGVPSG